MKKNVLILQLVECIVWFAFLISLVKYNLYTNAYPALYICYKLLLSLSVTQVSCERGFSKLKCVKSYLRSKLSQDRLESFMLMSIEKGLLNGVDADEIIDNMSTKSKVLKNLFLYKNKILINYDLY
jgi:hypothetical protein